MRLGDRDQLGEDLGLLFDAGAPAEENVDDLLEIKQPEGQPQVPRADDMRLLAETVGVFVVRIDEEDAEVGLLLQDLLQDQGDAGRFADAGRAEDGEVLTQELVEIDIGRNLGVERQPADLDRLALGDAVDDAEVIAAEQRELVADGRVVGHAALEIRSGGAVLLDLAEEVDVSDKATDITANGIGTRSGQLGDDADNPGGGRPDGDHPADGHPLLGIVLVALVEPRGRLRAGHRNDGTEIAHGRGFRQSRFDDLFHVPQRQLFPGLCARKGKD